MTASNAPAAHQIPDDARRFLEDAGSLVIGGEERPASDGASFSTVNPATEEVLARIAQASSVDVDEAVRTAGEAHRDGRWRKKPPGERGRVLARVADAIERDLDALAWIEVLDSGKPLRTARQEVRLAADCFRYFAGFTDKVYGETIPVRDDRLVYSLRDPVGVCAQISPWNFPIVMAAWKVAPALAFANTLVLKPAEQTPLTALWLTRLLHEAGVPDGVANLLQGTGEETGAALVAHPGLDKITFTGSTEVGRSIMRSAADNLHKVTLELGGKSPNIVFPDADLDIAARFAPVAVFHNSGQVCTAGTRLVVDAKVHDELVGRITEAANGLEVGPGWQDGVRLGPLVSAQQFERVSSYVDIGRDEGAEVVAGGHRADGWEAGYYYAPTVLDRVTPEMRVAQEEIFGPVLAVQTYHDEDEAVAIANSTPYGLAAGVWTRDVARAHRVAAKIEAGTVWINTYQEFSSAVSFGGYRDSGIGRELGKHAVEAYTQTKHVWLAL